MVRSVSCRPTTCRHWPRRISSPACGTRWSRQIANATTSSATDRLLTPGVHPSATPWRSIAARSSESSPTPYLLTTFNEGRAERRSASIRSRPTMAFSHPSRNRFSSSPASTAPDSLKRTSEYRASSSARSVGCRENDRDATPIPGTHRSRLITPLLGHGGLATRLRHHPPGVRRRAGRTG